MSCYEKVAGTCHAECSEASTSGGVCNDWPLYQFSINMSEKTSISSWKYARICLQILMKEYMFKKGAFMATITCPVCSSVNQASASYCRTCGRALQVASSGVGFNTATGRLLPNSLLKQRYRILTTLG